MKSLARRLLLADLEGVSGTEGGPIRKVLVSDGLWERLQPLLPPPLLTDAQGIPLTATVTAANVN